MAEPKVCRFGNVLGMVPPERVTGVSGGHRNALRVVAQ